MNLIPTAQHLLSQLGIHADVNAFLIVFGLAVARLATALSLAPFFGGQTVSGQVRTGLAVILTATLTPYLVANPAIETMNVVLFVALLLKEVMIGAVIGFVSQLVFLAVQAAGTLIDTGRGMNQPAYVTPQLPGHLSALGQLKFQAAIVLFLAMNGHLMFINTLHSSFTQLPVLSFPKFPPGGFAFADQMARITGSTISIGMQLAAPVLLALFMVDVAFGALGKIASQINVHQESQPVKALAGLAVLLLAIGFIMTRLNRHFADMLDQIAALVRSLANG